MIIDDRVEREQLKRLRAFRARRRGDFRAALEDLDAAARTGENVMPHIVHAVRKDCTVGEIVATLKKTFGEHREQGF
jgi:methylmalonyl-CoA mutase N-terminal domain/subunit